MSSIAEVCDGPKVYYAKAENPNYHGRRKFLYVVVSKAMGNTIVVQREQVREKFTSDEVHLTTDGAWDKYLEKRKTIPRLVKIFNTQRQLEDTAEMLGFVI